MFNTLEDLKAAVEERRKAILTLEVDIANTYSAEHEAAKQELATAKGMKTLTGGGFLADNLAELEARVAETKPPAQSVWIQFSKLPLEEWRLLTKQSAGLDAYGQYEKVLPKTFIGVYGQDPTEEDDEGNLVHPGLEPLSTNHKLLSAVSGEGILPGGALNSVVQAYMTWQNSGGEVTIRPTKSGRD